MKRFDRLFIFPRLVIHQTEVGLEFGDFWMEIYRLAGKTWQQTKKSLLAWASCAEARSDSN